MLRPIIKARPSIDYFSTVIKEKFSFAISTTSVNFRAFFVHGMSYRPTDLSLLKDFEYFLILSMIIIFPQSILSKVILVVLVYTYPI